MNRQITEPKIDETTMNEMIATRKAREYNVGKFGDNLYRFFCEMAARGYKVIKMSCDYDYERVRVQGGYQDLDEVTYQAQNYEGCNVRLQNTETSHGQTIAVDYSGDDWCDVVPIVDWTVPRDHPDTVNEVVGHD